LGSGFALWDHYLDCDTDSMQEIDVEFFISMIVSYNIRTVDNPVGRRIFF
jgi:hypothetical protein